MFVTHSYLGLAFEVLYYACYIWLLGYFLWHRQWGLTLVSLLFAFCGGGFLIALVIGWQEEKNWKIRRLMVAYTALTVVWFSMLAHSLFENFTTQKPPEVTDAKSKARMKAGRK